MLVRVYERYVSGTEWLHGFYAFSSYSQIALSAGMDAVSVGWARMELDDQGAPVLNSTSANGQRLGQARRRDPRHRLLGGAPGPPTI